MARIDIQRDHHLDAAQARAVVDKVAARLGEKFGTTSRWEGDTLRFERSGVKGGITLEPALVRVQAELGMLLSPMKGMIEQEIRQKLDQYFA
jgi:putative polyhydroxyalkanoate system protein